MGQCLRCQHNPVTPRLLLEVQTLHIRDIAGEKRVQALGNFVEAGVCEDCARRWRAEQGRTAARLAKPLGAALVLLAVGTAAFLLLEELPLKIFGLGALVCGLTVAWSAVQRLRRERADARGRSEAENLERANWDLLVSCLPKKAQDSDLTYLPVTEAFLDRTVQELVLEYDLLPAIARKAREMAAERLGKPLSE